MNIQRFHNRQEAGRLLAAKLSDFIGRSDVLVLALPRGGVPVGAEVARALDAPLDVLLVRKLGVPGMEELAMGAVASDGVRVLNHEVVRTLGITDEEIDEVTYQEQQELARRELRYRGNRPFPVIQDQTVILVDDGLATGASMRAAIQALRQYGPATIVIAVPVASLDTCEKLAAEGEQVIGAVISNDLYAVGLGYDDFSQTTDDEVTKILAQAARDHSIAHTVANKQARFTDDEPFLEQELSLEDDSIQI